MKDVHDTKTQELNISLSKAEQMAVKAALQTQIRSLERSARASTTAGRAAMAELYTAEAIALSNIAIRL